ncbi:MAG: L,D-transpeptidase family protein [Patescibacteria group bacterium]
MSKTKKILFFFLLLLPTILMAIYIYAFTPTFASSPEADKDAETILPTETFTIKFDKPLKKSYYQENISLEPPTPMKAIINDTHTEITLMPTKGWEADTKYTLALPEGRSKNFMPINSTSFTFETSAYPQVTDVTPHSGATDVVLDIEDPMKVDFDKSTEGFFMDFILSPDVPIEFQNNAEKTEFSILPKEPLAEDQLYTLSIRAKVQGADSRTYVPIHTTTFTTPPPKPKTWAEKLEDRVVYAKQNTQPRIKDGKYIDVNLSTQIMTIFEDGQNKGSFLISSGKPGMDTPKGNHRVYNKHPRPWSKEYGLYMPYWMAITPSGSYGIHELPEWPGGYKEGQNHLGIKVSHGCMRLGVGPAEKVYGWADIGTPVIVY